MKNDVPSNKQPVHHVPLSMTNPLRLSLLACATLAATTLSSCVYDPYYRSSVSTGVGYSNRNFSTSMMVRTSDSRWFYDPDCLSYYDSHRHCYYDPYLRGYYPVGCRPPRIHGAPHPYGWHRGASVCRPPTQVRTTWINNHQDRYRSYRNLNESWSRNCRPGDSWNHGEDRHGSNWNRGDENRYGANRNYNGWSSERNSGNNGSSRGFRGQPTGNSNHQGDDHRDHSGGRGYERPQSPSTHISTPPVTREPRGNSGGFERPAKPEKPERTKEPRQENSHSEKSERSKSKKHED